jgi:putative peptidoglycan lipid II flippase
VTDELAPGAGDPEFAATAPAAPEAAERAPSTTGANLLRAGVIVSAAYLASRLLGYVRVVVLGSTFGAGEDLDAFFAAFRVPDLIFQLVAAGALSSALIPIVTGLLATGQSARAWRVVSIVSNVMLVGLAILAAVAFVAAPAIVPAITPGFGPDQLELTISLTRIMLVAPILLALGAAATSTLNAQGRFAAAAAAPIVYNLAIIAAAIVLGPLIGVTGLAIGTVLGSAGHLLVQVPRLRGIGFRWSAAADLRDPEARRAFLLMAPRAVGLGATQIIFIVMTSLASGVGPGAITAYNLAFTTLQIPIGVIGVPLGIVVFPAMARELATGGSAAYLGLLVRSVRLLLFVMLPIATVAIVLRREIVELLFGYGRFEADAVDLTSMTLAWFMAGLAAHASIAVLARAFYARQDTRTPVAAALLAAVVDVALAILLVGPLGLSGLALAMATGAWLETIVLLVALRRREPALDLPAIASAGAITLGAAIAAAAVAAITSIGLAGILPDAAGKLAIAARAAAAAGGAAAVYLLAARLAGLPELSTLLRTVRVAARRGAAT